MPCGLYLLAFCQDLRAVQSPQSAEATATGQFMLVRANAYWMVGGHAAARAAICEDLALARLLKRSGRHVLLRDGSALVATRMYSGWRTLWPGIVKNLVEMLGGPLPALAGPDRGWTEMCARQHRGLPGIVAGPRRAAGRDRTACRRRGLLPHSDLVRTFVPFGYSVGALMALDSVRWRLRGRVAWKGRTTR